MKDKITIQAVALLHPKVRQQAMDFINEEETATGLTFRIDQGLRTFQQQQTIYNQGRTTPGKIVTWAPPGTSYHNYGLAFDQVPIVDGKLNWNYDFSKVKDIAAKHGFTWGGDFPPDKQDLDHFENKLGHNWRDLLHLWTIKKFIPGTTYVDI